ncbi:hypothetical protein PTKIN_Ptkin16aG0493100 [Pterospermum kingtungense]
MSTKVPFVNQLLWIMDDLVVKQMSTIFQHVTVLNKFEVKEVGALEERVVNFVMNIELSACHLPFGSPDMDENLRSASQEGNIVELYASIQRDCNILRHLDEMEFVNTPLHIAAAPRFCNGGNELKAFIF